MGLELEVPLPPPVWPPAVKLRAHSPAPWDSIETSGLTAAAIKGSGPGNRRGQISQTTPPRSAPLSWVGLVRTLLFSPPQVT